MAQSVISYDKDLPAVPGRCAWQAPASYLVKDESAESGWRVEASGRRPSNLLLIEKLRKAVTLRRSGCYDCERRSVCSKRPAASRRSWLPRSGLRKGDNQVPMPNSAATPSAANSSAVAIRTARNGMRCEAALPR